MAIVALNCRKPLNCEELLRVLTKSESCGILFLITVVFPRRTAGRETVPLDVKVIYAEIENGRNAQGPSVRASDEAAVKCPLKDWNHGIGGGKSARKAGQNCPAPPPECGFPRPIARNRRETGAISRNSGTEARGAWELRMARFWRLAF
jgi:hypothetical protein